MSILVNICKFWKSLIHHNARSQPIIITTQFSKYFGLSWFNSWHFHHWLRYICVGSFRFFLNLFHYSANLPQLIRLPTLNARVKDTKPFYLLHFFFSISHRYPLHVINPVEHCQVLFEEPLSQHYLHVLITYN